MKQIGAQGKVEHRFDQLFTDVAIYPSLILEIFYHSGESLTESPRIIDTGGQVYQHFIFKTEYPF